MIATAWAGAATKPNAHRPRVLLYTLPHTGHTPRTCQPRMSTVSTLETLDSIIGRQVIKARQEVNGGIDFF